jgi:hypothetical protein
VFLLGRRGFRIASNTLSSRTASRSTPTLHIGARVIRLFSFKECFSRWSFIWTTASQTSKTRRAITE